MTDIIYDGHEVTWQEWEEILAELRKKEDPVNPWGFVYITPRLKEELDKAFDDYLKTKFN